LKKHGNQKQDKMKISDYTLLEFLNLLGYTEDDLEQSNTIQIAIEQWLSSSNGKEPCPFYFDEDEKKEFIEQPLLDRVYHLMIDEEKFNYDTHKIRILLEKRKLLKDKLGE
jgi:hypothetical protein